MLVAAAGLGGQAILKLRARGVMCCMMGLKVFLWGCSKNKTKGKCDCVMRNS